MAYQHKINWSDPAKGSDVVSFTMEPVKTAVLDFHLQIENELGELIKLHFRDPDSFKIKRSNFDRRVALVRAPIGKTLDDEIWSIVNKSGEFRNVFAHNTPTPELLQKYADEILEQYENDRVVSAFVDTKSRLSFMMPARREGAPVYGWYE